MDLLVFFPSLIALVGACGMTVEQKRRAPPLTAIINANVWNGSGFAQNKTVVLLGGIISHANPYGAIVVDAKGGFLLPGLIDTHCHNQSCSYLNAMRQYDVTTALDMGTFPYSAVTACRAVGLTDIYGSGAAATVNGTTISHFSGLPSDSFVPDAIAARKFVADREAQGVDYIKVILDPPSAPVTRLSPPSCKPPMRSANRSLRTLPHMPTTAKRRQQAPISRAMHHWTNLLTVPLFPNWPQPEFM